MKEKYIVSKITKNKMHALLSYLNRSELLFDVKNIDTDCLGMINPSINFLNTREEILYTIYVSENYVYVENEHYLNLRLDMHDLVLMYEYNEECKEARIYLKDRYYNDEDNPLYICIWDYEIDVENKVQYLANIKALKKYFEVGCDEYKYEH